MYFLIFCLFTIFLISLLLLINATDLVEKLSVWIWAALLLHIIVQVLKTGTCQKLTNKLLNFFDNFTNEIKFGRNFKILIFFLASIFLLAAGLSRKYYLGGDDSRLFYLYPWEFLANFSDNVGSNMAMSALTGFLPPPSILYFSGFLVALKKILGFLNLQQLLYTLNFILGAWFFYKLLGYLSGRKKGHISFIGIIGSLVYVFSTFNIYSLYNSKLIAIFLLSIFPFSLYFFLKGVKEQKPAFIFLVALVWTIFGVAAVALPWISALIIVAIPFIMVFFLKDKFRLLKYTLIFLISLALLNLHWLMLMPQTSAFKSSLQVLDQGISSQDYRNQAVEGIRSTASLNEIFYPMMSLYHYQIQKNFNWPYKPIYENWFLKILPLNVVFILSIILAGIAVTKKNKYSNIFAGSLLSLIVAFYFYNVNFGQTRFGNWGIGLFIWLNNTFPGFVMFRNMYDKFAPALAFWFSLAFSLSLYTLREKFAKNDLFRKALLLILLISLLNAKPLLFNEFNKLPIWSTQNKFESVSNLNKNYLDLVKFAKGMETDSRFVFLPLEYGNIIQIRDQNVYNHFYNGVSPFLILSGKNDFSGILSFGGFSEDASKKLLEGKFEEVGRLFQKMNLKYVVINKKVPQEFKSSYVYTQGLYEAQNDSFYKEILGDKIKDFGDDYSLYLINPKYDSEKIYLTGDSGNAEYRRISYSKYEVILKDFWEKENLVFLEPYSDEWEILSQNGKILNLPHDKIFAYANSWGLKNLEGTNREQKIYIYYKPYNYYVAALGISFISFLSLTGYLFWQISKRKGY